MIDLKKILFSSFLLKVIFTISLFILIFISAISYQHSLSLAESTKWVMHSYKAEVALEKIFSNLKDAETAQRGLLITHDPVFIDPYITAKERVYQSSYEFEKLVEDNLKQQNNLDSLSVLINLRLSHLKENLELSRQVPINKILLLDNVILGKQLMDRIRIQINKMVELEMVYLKERQAKYDHEISFTPLITLMFLLFALLVFVFSYWKINRDLNILKIANADLIIANESTSHAQEIGAFSSWVWDLETNKLTYSDNQYLLLGCKPQSFEPSIENFLKFVHPKDKHIITDGEKQVRDKNKYAAAHFRIIRTDGAVRHFKSLSKVITGSNGKQLLIGINSDVTEQHLSNLALEERNRELEQSNNELASFNHVASHDLQEPLRIVQTYISRLNEKEIGGMSEKGKEYFVKIKFAITRMRILIDALLLYSRANKAEKVFEAADLNQILESAKQDLIQLIEEKNVKIKSAELPALSVIPFQIQQVFTNLIGNSIKYSKPNLAPVINIECKKIVAKDEPILNNDSTKTYYKISFIDNGLGFEQQYSEKIFSLFQRLHNDKEFEGTGIGLSICKKIAENHAGYIFAHGEPNVGATFTLFLPDKV